MSEWTIPANRAGSRTLGAGECLEITFQPGRRGQVSIVTSCVFGGGLLPGFGFKRRVDLFLPGTAEPAVSREDYGSEFATTLSHLVTLEQAAIEGDWIARVTNLDNRPAVFILQAAFPGTATARTTQIPVSIVREIVNKLLAPTKIRITRGRDACCIAFAPVLNLPPVFFDVPVLQRTINLMTVRLELNEFPNDINSSTTQFALINSSRISPSGMLRLTFAFDEEGREILGTFYVGLSEVRIAVELSLEVDDERLTYSFARATCHVQVEIAGLPDGLLNAIFHYQETLQRRIVEAVEHAFERDEVRDAISDGMMAIITPLLGGHEAIASVTVSSGQLVITSFAAPAAAELPDPYCVRGSEAS
jgi:hypothetical protein